MCFTYPVGILVTHLNRIKFEHIISSKISICIKYNQTTFQIIDEIKRYGFRKIKLYNKNKVISINSRIVNEERFEKICETLFLKCEHHT